MKLFDIVFNILIIIFSAIELWNAITIFLFNKQPIFLSYGIWINIFGIIPLNHQFKEKQIERIVLSYRKRIKILALYAIFGCPLMVMVGIINLLKYF
jgi:hypothetical protein